MTSEALQPETLQAAILGSDVILAALPAEPVQVIHAVQALGFDIVVPASWGDELIATGVLEELASRPPGTSILCSCPNARRRMLANGNELSPFLVNTISPPVAAARYLRALHNTPSLQVTYIGECPGAEDESINGRMTPGQFIDICAQRNISLVDQPSVFESRIPIDRRRHISQPGGLPTAEAIGCVRPGTDLVTLDINNCSFDVAQSVISGRIALLDLAPAVGCPCSGFVAESEWNNGRATVAAHEPPRSATPVIDSRIDVDLELPGQSPQPPAYEESIPLSVVVGADLSDFGHARMEKEGGKRAGVNNLNRDDSVTADSRTDQPMLADAASAIEANWGDLTFDYPGDNTAAALDPAGAAFEDPGDQVRPASGTPTGTPAIMTPSGPLPRAYMMVRKLRASGEHPSIAAVGAPDANGNGRSTAQGAHENEHDTAASEESDPREQQESRPVAQQGRGTVDTVLDILSKAIRDVVEP